jgi:hypothetical protein
VEVRPLRGLEEADQAARVCKRAFNRIQEPQFGRLVSFPDEEKTCRAHRYFASLERVRATLFFIFALSPPPPNYLNFFWPHDTHRTEENSLRCVVCVARLMLLWRATRRRARLSVPTTWTSATRWRRLVRNHANLGEGVRWCGQGFSTGPIVLRRCQARSVSTPTSRSLESAARSCKPSLVPPPAHRYHVECR